MVHDPRSLLWDARRSGEAILRFTAGRSLDDYLSDDIRRAAVERHLGIIGEALNRLRRLDPSLAAKIAVIDKAVGLRNVLIHGYAKVDSRAVWSTVQDDLPGLTETLSALLAELGEP